MSGSVRNAEPYGDMPAASPTSLVLSYLKNKGVPLSSENVRRTLEESARDPQLIPGLRSEEPPPADQRTSGSRPSVAKNIEGQAPPSSQGEMKVRPGESAPGVAPGGSPRSSAQPESSGGPGLDVGNIGQTIMQGLALGGAGAGAGYLARDAMNRPNYQLGMGDPGAAPPGSRPPTGDRYDLLPPPQQSPFDAAMGRAMEPATGIPTPGGSASSADLDAVLGAGRMPPGVSPVDAVNAGQGVQGVTGSSMPEPGEGNIPLKRKVTVEEHLPPLLPPRGAGGAVRPAMPTPHIPRLMLR